MSGTPRLVNAFGRTQTAYAWSMETGIKYRTLMSRLASNLSPEDALSKPVVVLQRREFGAEARQRPTKPRVHKYPKRAQSEILSRAIKAKNAIELDAMLRTAEKRVTDAKTIGWPALVQSWQRDVAAITRLIEHVRLSKLGAQREVEAVA